MLARHDWLSLLLLSSWLHYDRATLHNLSIDALLFQLPRQILIFLESCLNYVVERLTHVRYQLFVVFLMH